MGKQAGKSMRGLDRRERRIAVLEFSKKLLRDSDWYITDGFTLTFDPERNFKLICFQGAVTLVYSEETDLYNPVFKFAQEAFLIESK